MNDTVGRLDPSKKPDALRRLVEHLASLDAGRETPLIMESDMLSLIVSGTLNGEDISRRYPAFYQKLLEYPELRQAFLDALESMEAERTGEMVPFPEQSRVDLSFLKGPSSSPVVEEAGKHRWRVTWQRTLEQLQAIFSPPELAYRADHAQIEDPWFTLLREEMMAGGSQYAVALDCTLSHETDNSLATFLNLAVTLGGTSQAPDFPVRASLQWGSYQASIVLTEEGRAKFPDIPLDQIFDPTQSQLQDGLRLTLEAIS